MKLYIPTTNTYNIEEFKQFNPIYVDNGCEIVCDDITCIWNNKTNISIKQFNIMMKYIDCYDCIIYSDNFNSFDMFTISESCCVILNNKNIDYELDFSFNTLHKSIIKKIRQQSNFKMLGYNKNMNIFQMDGNSKRQRIIKEKNNHKPLKKNEVDNTDDFNTGFFDSDFFDDPQIIPSLQSYMFVVPFMYNGDRWNIFEKSIDNLYNLTKDKNNFSICIHECGTEQHISKEFIEKYQIKYIYSYWNDVFHRAWALNKPCKKYCYEDIYIFFDGDLIITDDWFESLKEIDPPCVGWNNLHYLTQKNTINFLKTNIITPSFEREIKPGLNGAAGGITIISNEIFFKLKGWPENFEGTWGGEDNLYYSKLMKFGFKVSFLNADIYHLFHEHQTYRDKHIRNAWYVYKKWSKLKWEKELKIIGNNWGN